jgi:acetate kinase
LTLDPQANAGGEPCISAPLSKVMAFAIPTDEEIVMAQIASHLLFRVRTRLSG